MVLVVNTARDGEPSPRRSSGSTRQSFDLISLPAEDARPKYVHVEAAQAHRDRRPISIALISDYCFPKVGGVESHIYQLGQLLLRLGHRVVLVTHSYKPDRHGIRYLSCGLKIYYLPLEPLPPQSAHATLPAFFHAFPHLRQIFIRERIELVHAHVALSALGMEAILHARTMGIKAVFTDHSLLGLGGYGEIWGARAGSPFWAETTGNKVSKAVWSDIEAAICVSHTAKENTVIRGSLDPSLVHVIPNAVVASAFRPAEPPLPIDGQITIVCVSRLVYRKGIDLLIAALPRVCSTHPDVRFVIAGDGPKTVELEQMRERHQALLGDRVELLGAIRHELVRDVLVRGHIFLNTSLTEAFGIGILEAACAGLYIVSTRVGGVPEILPPDLIDFAEPDVDDVVAAIDRAVAHVKAGRHDPIRTHARVSTFYSWADVARRTERVYELAMASKRPPLIERFRRSYGVGVVFGKLMILLIAVDYLFLALLELLWPAESIDEAPPFDQAVFREMCELERDEVAAAT